MSLHCFVATITVNYVIALKFGGKAGEAKRILKNLDVTAASPAFRLAKAVLQDDFALAHKIMIGIGKKGDLIQESSYHVWPLFREFRTSKEFLDAYELVYGYSFATQLANDAASAIASTEKLLGGDGAQLEAAPLPADSSALIPSTDSAVSN